MTSVFLNWGFDILQITGKCLHDVLKLQHLEELLLEGCFGVDDDSLKSLRHDCKSLKVTSSPRNMFDSSNMMTLIEFGIDMKAFLADILGQKTSYSQNMAWKRCYRSSCSLHLFWKHLTFRERML